MGACLDLFLQVECALGLFKIEADNELGWFILGLELPSCSLGHHRTLTDGCAAAQGRTVNP